MTIAQVVLDQTGHGLESGAFETFADCFAIPTTLDTFDGQVTLSSRDEIEDRFRSVVAFFQSKNADAIVRHVVEASWFDAQTIHSTHHTKMVAGKTLIGVPHTVFSVLRNIGGKWKVTFSQYAIPDPQHNEALIGSQPKEGATT